MYIEMKVPVLHLVFHHKTRLSEKSQIISHAISSFLQDSCGTLEGMSSLVSTTVNLKSQTRTAGELWHSQNRQDKWARALLI